MFNNRSRESFLFFHHKNRAEKCKRNCKLIDSFLILCSPKFERYHKVSHFIVAENFCRTDVQRRYEKPSINFPCMEWASGRNICEYMCGIVHQGCRWLLEKKVFCRFWASWVLEILCFGNENFMFSSMIWCAMCTGRPVPVSWVMGYGSGRRSITVYHYQLFDKNPW